MDNKRVDKDLNNWNSLALLVGMQASTTTQDSHLSVTEAKRMPAL